MPVALLLVLGALTPGQLSEEFVYEFRSAPTLHPALQLFGPSADLLARMESEGLRIRLPAQRPQPGSGVGITPRFAISGDFEITASYDLVSAEQATKGRGSGVSLYLVIGEPMQAAATLGRVNRPEEGESYVLWRALRKEKREGGDRMHILPAKVNTGKLRLARSGSQLHYLVAEGKSQDFRELAREEFARGDVRLLRLAANTGESPTALDVRLRDLRIRAERLPREPAAATIWNRVWLVQGALLGLGAAGYHLWRWRHRQSAGPASRAAAASRPQASVEAAGLQNDAQRWR